MKSKISTIFREEKIELRRQAGSVVVAKSKPQQFRNFVNHNATIFLRAQIIIRVFYVILVFWLHMSLKTFPASFLFIVNG